MSTKRADNTCTAATATATAAATAGILQGIRVCHRMYVVVCRRVCDVVSNLAINNPY